MWYAVRSAGHEGCKPLRTDVSGCCSHTACGRRVQAEDTPKFRTPVQTYLQLNPRSLEVATSTKKAGPECQKFGLLPALPEV